MALRVRPRCKKQTSDNPPHLLEKGGCWSSDVCAKRLQRRKIFRAFHFLDPHRGTACSPLSAMGPTVRRQLKLGVPVVVLAVGTMIWMFTHPKPGSRMGSGATARPG